MCKLQNYLVSLIFITIITCSTFNCTANIALSSSHKPAVVWFSTNLPSTVQKISARLLLKHHLSSNESSSDDIISLLLAPPRSPQPVSESEAILKYRFSLAQELLQHLFVNEYKTVYGNSFYYIKYPYKVFNASLLNSELANVHEEKNEADVFSLKVISVSMADTSERVVVVRALLYSLHEGIRVDNPIPVVGFCHVPHQLLRKVYLLSRGSALWQATMNCAREAIHAIWTGEIDPFAPAHASLLITPTLSLPVADLLQFTTTGRIAAPEGLKNLPTNDTSIFHPNILPISRVNTSFANRTISSLAITSNSLWQGNEPNLINVLKLGRALNVEYVLMARISDLEATSGPTQRRPYRFDGRAIAVGDLVRVSDGDILWKSSAEDTMHGYHSAQNETVKIMRFAELFALSGIADKFDTYKKSFLTLPESTHNAYIHH